MNRILRGAVQKDIDRVTTYHGSKVPGSWAQERSPEEHAAFLRFPSPEGSRIGPCPFRGTPHETSRSPDQEGAKGTFTARPNPIRTTILRGDRMEKGRYRELASQGPSGPFRGTSSGSGLPVPMDQGSSNTSKGPFTFPPALGRVLICSLGNIRHIW